MNPFESTVWTEGLLTSHDTYISILSYLEEFWFLSSQKELHFSVSVTRINYFYISRTVQQCNTYITTFVKFDAQSTSSGWCENGNRKLSLCFWGSKFWTNLCWLSGQHIQTLCDCVGSKLSRKFLDSEKVDFMNIKCCITQIVAPDIPVQNTTS